MKAKGFTLVELLATIIVLGLAVGITIITVNGGFGRAKEKTEEVFVKTIDDALKIYIANLTFEDVINSTYKPIMREDVVNPANKNKDNYECNVYGKLDIYRDDDYVYYYKIDKSSFGCLNTEGSISNLPDSCNG